MFLFGVAIVIIVVFVVYFLFFNRKSSPIPPPACLKDPKWGNHNFVTLSPSGLKMHYVEKGDKDKPLMLFVHGFPDFWFGWRHQVLHHSANYWCVAPDMRGYGDTDKPKGVAHYSLVQLVDDLRDLLVALGRSDCILVAHDWGGGIGYGFCAQYPEMVQKYIAINAASFPSMIRESSKSLVQQLKGLKMLFFQLPYLPELNILRNGPEDFFSKMMQMDDEDEVQAYGYAFQDMYTWTCAINYYRAAMRYPANDLIKKMESISVPVHAIYGTADKYISLGAVQGCKDFCTTFSISLIDGVSHFSQTEAPDLVNHQMDEYLRGTKEEK